MKKALPIIIYCLLNALLSFSQGVSWQWAKGAGGTSAQEGWAAATDKSGNLYVTGQYDGDTISFGTTILTDTDFLTFYIVKYSPTGDVLWARNSKSAVSWSAAFGLGIATDADNNVYATGYFNGDSISFSNVTLYSEDSSNQNIFVIKYDSSGNVLWARNSQGDDDDAPTSIAIDQSENVYITGSFSSDTISFDYLQLPAIWNDGFSKFFIAKYSSSGNIIWAKSTSYARGADVSGSSLATDSNGNICVTGYFSDGQIDFDSIVLPYSSTNATPDVFIAKFDSSGKVLWAKSGGGPYDTYGTGITSGKDCNIYVTGAFYSDTFTIDGYSLYNSTSTSAGNIYDFFILKCDSMGNLIWAKSAGGKGNSVGWCVTADMDDNVYVSGGFDSTSVSFDSITFLRPDAFYYDPMFEVTFDCNGKVVCGTALGSGGDDNNAVCLDGKGNAYIAGDFWVADFVIGTDTLPWTAYGNETAFAAKFSCDNKGCNLKTSVNNSFDYYFLQLHPNPFSNQAVVQYALPDDSQNATLIIYDILGRQCSSYQLDNTAGQININANNLSSGVYLYSLVLDGKTLATKKMVVQE